MRTTRRVTIPVADVTMDQIRQALTSNRTRLGALAPLNDVQTATARTLEMLATDVITVNLGPVTSRHWREGNADVRKDLRVQAGKVARHHGKEVRLRDDRGVLVHTARSHNDR
jgi:hypothetical protein